MSENGRWESGRQKKGFRGSATLARLWDRLKPTFLIASMTKSSLLHQSHIPESLGCRIEKE